MRKMLFAACAIALVVGLPGLTRADDKAEMQALIEKAIKAKGGADVIKKYNAETWKAKGKFYMGGDGIDYEFDFAMQGYDQSRVIIDLEIMGMKIKQTVTMNKDKGWTKIVAGGDNVVNVDLPKEMIEEGKLDLLAQYVASLKVFVVEGFKDFDLSPLGEVKVGDKPAIGVRVTRKGYKDISLFFDKETHLLVKADWRVKDYMQGGREMSQESIYIEFKEVQGLKEGTKFVMKRDGKLFFDGEISDYKLLDKLDDSYFEKP